MYVVILQTEILMQSKHVIVSSMHVHVKIWTLCRLQWYFVSKIVLAYCEKWNVQVIEEGLLKSENFWDHLNNFFEQWKLRTIFETECFLTCSWRLNPGTDTQRELFSKNLRLLGLGRHIGPKNVEAFGVFSTKLKYPSWHYESFVHGLAYLVVVVFKKTLDFRPKTYNSQIWYWP